MPYANTYDYNQYLRDYLRRRYYERRDRAIALLGGKCVNCGSTDNLQFDHIDHGQKSFDVADRLAQYSWDRLLTEIEKCQLLCFVCHVEKSVIERGQSMAHHGTASMYQHYKCRCDLCRDANSKYNASHHRVRSAKPRTKSKRGLDFTNIETWKAQ